jgi:hypothetical protein
LTIERMFGRVVASSPEATSDRKRPRVPQQSATDRRALIRSIDTMHARASVALRGLFELIAEADRAELWRDSGARDLPAWLAIRYGISVWKARRWVVAAHALEALPRLSAAFRSGELGIDKVVELARFTTPHSERKLIAWAKDVSCGAVRRRADRELSYPIEDVRDAERYRSVSWWYSGDGTRFGLLADLPACDGVVVAKALERAADELPIMPDEDGVHGVEARRADALVALASARTAADADPDRATVVVHADLGALVAGASGCEIENGPVIHSETARRLLCNGRVQTVIEDGAGRLVGLGRVSREPPAWMMRQLRYRDGGCRFPGCGARRFVQAHHIVWWERGGATDLDNLLLVCSFHHKLVHEHGWSIHGRATEERWLRPDGSAFEAGPGPPTETVAT